MREHEAPKCIVSYLRASDLHDADYHIYGAGVAISWVHMAADALDATDSHHYVSARYHVYAGISAARTAADAVASWLNLWLPLNAPPNVGNDLAKPRFRNRVSAHPRTPAAMHPHIDAIGVVAAEVDVFRQRVQHREGVHPMRSGDEWYIAPLGLKSPRTEWIEVGGLLRTWANELEQHVCALAALA